jgi:hypothetical protein
LKRADIRKVALPRARRYNPRMRLPRRRILWLSAALLLAVVACGWFLVPRSRISRENFDRIQEGMSRDDVARIIGKPTASLHDAEVVCGYEDGPNVIFVVFIDDKVQSKGCDFATPWQTIEWYVAKGAEKIGLKEP